MYQTLVECSKKLKIDRSRLRWILFDYKSELEISRENPAGFIRYPQKENEHWKINLEKLMKWKNENEWKWVESYEEYVA